MAEVALACCLQVFCCQKAITAKAAPTKALLLLLRERPWP